MRPSANFLIRTVLRKHSVVQPDLRRPRLLRQQSFKRKFLAEACHFRISNRDGQFRCISSMTETKSYQQAIDHLNPIQRLIGNDNVIFDEADIEKYVVDWTGNYRGGSLVCLPKSTDQVAALLSYCHAHRIGVVPQGGNTGLVGGGVGTKLGELILSLERMNQIISIDKNAGVLTCEAGCVLEWLGTETEKQGLVVPLDLGAKGSCLIGGNVSTNAGGSRLIKYGSLHGSVLGIEVVLANGQVIFRERPFPA